MTNQKLSILILRQLIADYTYTNNVIQYIKPEYFENEYSIVYKLCQNHFDTYNRCPNVESLEVELDTLKIQEELYDKTKSLISNIDKLNQKNPKIDTKWLIEQTEQFCKRRAYYLASLKVVESIDESEQQGLAIKELENAANFSFDADYGLNYRETFKKRFDLYTFDAKRIPFGIKQFDGLTGGGLFGKTLTLFLGPTGHGKSLIMSSMIANNLRDGLKVACYTFEMGDFRIAERIDANLLNIDINTWKDVGEQKFMSKAESMLSKVTGELFVKEYPNGGANASHIKKNLYDLKCKYGFEPDIVYVDYINIMGSKQLKASSKADSYIYMTTVAEELRGVAQELDLPIISAIQTNRSGQNNSNITLSEVGDSHGLSKTADYVISFTRIDDDETMKNKLFFKQLKNRYNSISYYEKFLIGVDYPKMRIYELDDNIQEVLMMTEKEKKEEAEILKKEIGSFTIDDFNSGKYDGGLFNNIKF